MATSMIPQHKFMEILSAVFRAGIVAILFWLGAQIVLLIAAIVIGAVVWLKSGFLEGMIAVLFTFVIGQGVAAFIIDIAFDLPYEPADGTQADGMRKD